MGSVQPVHHNLGQARHQLRIEPAAKCSLTSAFGALTAHILLTPDDQLLNKEELGPETAAVISRDHLLDSHSLCCDGVFYDVFPVPAELPPLIAEPNMLLTVVFTYNFANEAWFDDMITLW